MYVIVFQEIFIYIFIRHMFTWTYYVYCTNLHNIANKDNEPFKIFCTFSCYNNFKLMLTVQYVVYDVRGQCMEKVLYILCKTELN